MDSLLSDALLMSRVLYLVTDITIPAHQTVQLTAAYDRSPHQNHAGSRLGETGLFGFDLLTDAGSGLSFRTLTADLVLPEDTQIKLQNMGFEVDAAGKDSVVLNPTEPWYSIVVSEKP